MRPGTSGQNGKTGLFRYTASPTQRRMLRHWRRDQTVESSRVPISHTGTRFSAPHKKMPTSARTEETTIARDGATAIPGVFYMTDDGQETTVEDDELPQILLQARPAYRQPGYRAFREELNASQKARGFFANRRGAGGREQGPRMKRSSITQLKLRTRCARCRKIGHWARECPE